MNFSELEEKFLTPTYNRQPLDLVEGEGVKVKDSRGNEYLDFVAGIAVASLGHSDPTIAKALSEQAKKLNHVSNLYQIPVQAELGKKLAEITPKSIQKFFFCNSGTEAVEAALKLAVKHTGGTEILALEGSFHGRTCGSLGVTWKESYREPFKPLISENFGFTPRDDLEKLKENIHDKTAAIIAEPIQGEGGVNVLSNDFIRGLREICDDRNILLIFDEIQAGMCRTGNWFASDHFEVEPDIMTMAKALGNGFPIGCMGAKTEVMNSFSPGDHASTFGGNPVACVVAKSVIDKMEKENISKHVKETGDYFKSQLQGLSKEHESIQDVRGLGLMLAMELESEDMTKLVLERAREDGFLINRTAGNVLRFVPPLIIEKSHIDQLIKELNVIVSEVE